MRLIDADYLKQMFDIACGTNREVFDIAHSVYNFAIKTIDDAPTVEFPEQITIKSDTEEDKQKLLSAIKNAKLKVLVEEDRPHGEWIKTISENGVTSAVRCSECGFGDNRYMLFRYCPNCGADMRGKENEI